MKTMICLILDRSGSMQGREADVIGGVNSFIEEQKKLPDPASVAFVRFDTEIERFRPMQNLAWVEPLAASDFRPRGSTALLDAVGQTIMRLEDDWRAERPDRCIVVIVTDGRENASSEYTKAKVQALIKARQDSHLWAFIYLGANVDAFGEAAAMGISMANTAGYTNTADGVKHMYNTASASVGVMRSTGHTTAHNLGVANLGEEPKAAPATAGAAWTAPPTAAPSKSARMPPAF